MSGEENDRLRIIGEQADLIQRFVDHHAKWAGYGCLEADMEWDDIISDCIAQGFTPKDIR